MRPNKALVFAVLFFVLAALLALGVIGMAMLEEAAILR